MYTYDEVFEASKEYFNGNELSAKVFIDKYCLKDRDENYLEKTPDDMHKRLAKGFASARFKKDKSKKNEYLIALIEEFYNLFSHFTYILPQGRVMAGLGVVDSYRSLSNCLRLPPPKDSYSSILYSDAMLVSAAKRGCGYGIGISNLRPEGASVKNSAGSSTGSISFMERYSNSTREVAQAGRRGACLIDIDVRHPDVFKFATIKQEDDTKVTGANISIWIRDDFLNAVKKNEDYILRYPCEENIPDNLDIEYDKLTEINNVYYKKIKSQDLWNTIIHSAWVRADPGCLFKDRTNDYDPVSVYEEYRIDGPNACGEQPMAVYDTCRLICENLFSFVKEPFTKKAFIDYVKLYDISYKMMLLGDDLVDLEIEYVQRIIDKVNNDSEPEDEKIPEKNLWTNVLTLAKNARRVGCGITGLGDMLAALLIKYDSKKAMEVISRVMHTKMKAELNASIDMSEKYGPFVGWDANKEYEIKYKKPVKGKNDFYQFLLEEFPEQVERMCKVGRRNVNWSTIAPTGTASIECRAIKYFYISSGCEPAWAPHFRNKKINPTDKNCRTDFVDKKGDHWQTYAVVNGAFKDWYDLTCRVTYDNKQIEDLDKETIDKIFEKSPWYKSTPNEISWENRIKIQSILQKYTSSAISSTLNLPSSATEEDIKKIYFKGWEYKLKGVTIYRDGSRLGVLNTEKIIADKNAKKRPKVLPCEVYHITVKGESYFVLLGILDSSPYEVFAGKNINGVINKKATKGNITKKARGKYLAELDDGSELLPINAFLTDEEEGITRLCSTCLRHNVEMSFLVQQLEKVVGDIGGFAKSIARALKKNIKDGTKVYGEECPDCDSELIRIEGCIRCKACDFSKCG